MNNDIIKIKQRNNQEVEGQGVQHLKARLWKLFSFSRLHLSLQGRHLLEVHVSRLLAAEWIPTILCCRLAGLYWLFILTRGRRLLLVFVSACRKTGDKRAMEEGGRGEGSSRREEGPWGWQTRTKTYKHAGQRVTHLDTMHLPKWSSQLSHNVFYCCLSADATASNLKLHWAIKINQEVNYNREEPLINRWAD